MISISDVKIVLNSELDAALRVELIENASTILTMLRGTNPLDRGMGLVPGEIVGRNVYTARAAYTVQAIEQIEQYEPRLEVAEIDFEATENKLIPKVVLTYNGNGYQ